MRQGRAKREREGGGEGVEREPREKVELGPE